MLKRVQDTEDYLLDTAVNYGDAESLIGSLLPEKLNDKIVTKIEVHKFETSKDIINKIKNSLFRVKQQRFYGVLLHNSEVIKLNNFSELIDSMSEAVNLGLTLKIGVSCYEGSDISSTISKTSLCTHFQIPENVADRRNQFNYDFIKLHKSGISITVRSIFLQGLLLSDIKDVSNFFLPSVDVLDSIDQSSKVYGVSKLKYCLDYIRTLTWNDGIVIGIENISHLDQISEELVKPIIIHRFDSKTFNSFFVDPRNWSKFIVSNKY